MWGLTVILLCKLQNGNLKQSTYRMVWILPPCSWGWGVLARSQAVLQTNKGFRPEVPQQRAGLCKVSDVCLAQGRKALRSKNVISTWIGLFVLLQDFVFLCQNGHLPRLCICSLEVASVFLPYSSPEFLVLEFPKIKAAFTKNGEAPYWTRSMFLGPALMLLAVNV